MMRGWGRSKLRRGFAISAIIKLGRANRGSPPSCKDRGIVYVAYNRVSAFRLFRAAPDNPMLEQNRFEILFGKTAIALWSELCHRQSRSKYSNVLYCSVIRLNAMKCCENK